MSIFVYIIKPLRFDGSWPKKTVPKKPPCITRDGKSFETAYWNCLALKVTHFPHEFVDRINYIQLDQLVGKWIIGISGRLVQYVLTTHITNASWLIVQLSPASKACDFGPNTSGGCIVEAQPKLPLYFWFKQAEGWHIMSHSKGKIIFPTYVVKFIYEWLQLV